MALKAGHKLAHYEILEPIGAGGMGEVYKANDTRLDRSVAIKVLPSHLAADAGLRKRFEQEARAVSSLNHPHICTLYDVGREDGIDFIVMELLEGETLAERLKRGALPLDEALRYGVEIADALDKAHRRGVVHRDLKPGNVMITPPGTKLLDFGLAKVAAAGPSEGVSVLSALPTEARALTAEGSIIGTLQYMAPEQLEGEQADARTDIFAFGALLYEMVTGTKAFEGKSQASLIAAILERQPPPISTLQSMSPPALDRLVRKCLAKDPEERWATAHDLHDELQWTGESGSETEVSTPTVRHRGNRERIVAALAAGVVAAAIASLVTWSWMRPAPPRLERFVINLPPGARLDTNAPDTDVSISLDGTRIVYVARTEEGRLLYTRTVDQLEATALQGLGGSVRSPLISPDGNWVAFLDRSTNELKKVSIHGGPPVTICQLKSPMRGLSWGPDNAIIFADVIAATGLWRVPAGGGDPESLTTPDTDKGEINHSWPETLPGGQSVLFTIEMGMGLDQIAVLSLETGEQKILIPGGSHPRYTATGHIVYSVPGALRAVAFDVGRLEVTSDPVPVLEGVTTKGSRAANFSVSAEGSLVYTAGPTQGGEQRTLVWVDREGIEEAVTAEPHAYAYPRISPDGGRVALDVRDQNSDIWIWDFARETLTRLTFDPANDNYPVWTPDGTRVAFASSRGGPVSLFWKAADGTGTAERLTESKTSQSPHSFSPDAKQLVFKEAADPGFDLHVRALDGEGSSEPLLATEFIEQNAELSPNGRWLAYESNASGQFQIYVRPFPNVHDGQWLISRSGGTRPLWARDGRELFYLSPDGPLMRVPVQTDANFVAGNAEVSFEEAYYGAGGPPGRTYDISPDGTRFLMIKEGVASDETSAPTELILVQNWFEELKRLVPTDN